MQYIKLWAQNKSQVWPKLGHTCDFMLLFNPDIPTECNFNMLSQKYQLEQIELDDKIKMLKEALTESRQTVDDAKKWIVVVKQYSEPTELTKTAFVNRKSLTAFYKPPSDVVTHLISASLKEKIAFFSSDLDRIAVSLATSPHSGRLLPKLQTGTPYTPSLPVL